MGLAFPISIMPKNEVSVHSYFSVDSHETSQKQSKSTKFASTDAKSTGFKAKASAKAEPETKFQSDSALTRSVASNFDEQRSRKPRYLGPIRLTKSVVASICWWARTDGGDSPEGFMQVLQSNGKPIFQLIHPKTEVGLKNRHLLNTRKPSRIAAVFVDKDGQSDPVWIDLKREALIQ